MGSMLDRPLMMTQIFSYEVPNLWLWGALAAFLLINELVTGTFVMVFLAVGALVTGIIAEIFPMPFSFQLILFGTIAVGSLFAGRGFIKKRLARTSKERDLPAPDVLAEFVLDSDIPAQGQAAVSYQGAPWTAMNMGVDHLPAGTRVRVVRTEGIKLIVEKA